jgi:N-acetylmuramoyl-L-alanine amidase
MGRQFPNSQIYMIVFKIIAMRVFLASSIGVTCTAVLVAPLALPATATAVAADSGHSGSTRSLPLDPLGTNKRAGTAAQNTQDGQKGENEQNKQNTHDGSSDVGLTARDVAPFSLVGVVWEDATAELNGRARVRTRAVGTGEWSGWQELARREDAPDPEPGAGHSGATHGGTAPLWVGDCDGVQVRIRPEAGTRPALPRGMRVELVAPESGPDPLAIDGATDEDAVDDPVDRPADPAPPDPSPETAAGGAGAQSAAIGAEEIPARDKRDKEDTEAGPGAAYGEPHNSAEGGSGAQAGPYIAPRPDIVAREGWQADERLREGSFLYTRTVKAAFVHHTATGNNYTCEQAPGLLRAIYRYHVRSLGWRDIGYNFLIDKCGRIYEGRSGGVAKPVMGAHTYGFNSNTTGIAVLGSYDSTKPPEAAVDGLAKLTAWKLGLHGVNPRGSVTLTSGGGTKHPKGVKVRMRTISGHRDAFATSCPGTRLYSDLGAVRVSSARLQGR